MTTASPEDVKGVARGYYDAIVQKDFERVAAAIADDIVLYEPTSVPHGGTYHGRDAFFEALGGSASLLDTEAFDLQHLLVDGEYVAAFVAIPFRDRPSEVMYVIDWLRIRDGKIAELRPFFWDTAALLT
jgi:uncharacterized protein